MPDLTLSPTANSPDQLFTSKRGKQKYYSDGTLTEGEEVIEQIVEKLTVSFRERMCKGGVLPSEKEIEAELLRRLEEGEKAIELIRKIKEVIKNHYFFPKQIRNIIERRIAEYEKSIV